jgi:flagellar biosynthetic protein FliR
MVFAVFLIFCRIGGCVLFAPGLSSTRIPVQIRLLLALGITLAISPLLFTAIAERISVVPPASRPALIAEEIVIGSVIGLMGRFYLLSLQFAATAVSSMIGLAGIPGVPMEEFDAGSPLATLASTAAVMMILIMNLHLEMLRAIIDSYDVIAVNAFPQTGAILSNVMNVTAETAVLALRLAAPFIAYGVVVNIALGMANRFTPHISIYHATTGAVMLGGFLLLYLLWQDWLTLFLGSYQSWLIRGGF